VFLRAKITKVWAKIILNMGTGRYLSMNLTETRLMKYISFVCWNYTSVIQEASSKATTTAAATM
jgi:hypothetical protein